MGLSISYIYTNIKKHQLCGILNLHCQFYLEWVPATIKALINDVLPSTNYVTHPISQAKELISDLLHRLHDQIGRKKSSGALFLYCRSAKFYKLSGG